MKVTDSVFVLKMMQQLSSCKYFYPSTVSGCYDALVQNYGFEPESSKEEVIEKFNVTWNIFIQTQEGPTNDGIRS